MPSTILGLPAHPLIVHAVVVLVPLAALLLGASAVAPRFRHWARYASPATALVGLVMVPLATSSGENLEHDVQETAALREHTALGDTLLPFMIGVTVLAFALAWFELRSSRRDVGDVHDPTLGAARSQGLSARLGSPAVVRIVAVLAVVAALGTLVQVGRIGHSGAKSVWSQTSTSGGGADEGAPAR